VAARRCILDPAAPRLTLAIPVAKNLPRAWLDAMKRCDRIYTHPQSFPEINGADMVPDRIRKRRLERLRTVVLLAKAMIRRADRRTLRVGDQRADGLCTGVTIAEYARATGLCERCVSRGLAEGEGKYWRSVQPVVELKTPIQRKRGGGMQTHAGLPSVRVLTPLFFKRLGITDRKLARARRHGAQAWERRRAPPASLVGIRQMFRHMRDTLQAETERSRRERFAASSAARLERLRPKPKP
jgi:hypothetical protein